MRAILYMVIFLIIQGCSHFNESRQAETNPVGERSIASMSALSSTAKYNVFSERLNLLNNQFASENMDADFDEGAGALVQPTDYVTPEDVRGSESIIPELEKTVRDSVAGNGSWAFEFIYVDPTGKEFVLSQYNVHQSLMLASTNKVFTGYLAYVKKSYPDNKLAAMLHVSHNGMAEASLKSFGNTQTLKKYYSDLEDANQYNPYDGSGYIAKNRATPRLQISLLKKIYKSENYDKFKLLLAHPQECSYDTIHGQDPYQHPYHSTLSSKNGRFSLIDDLATRLHAKTGTYPTGKVKGLIGFVDIPTKTGKTGTILFSMLNNGSVTSWAFPKILAAVKLHTDYVDKNLAN